MIILVGGEKGGTGKTTLSTNLAATLISQGKDILVVDTDHQGSFTAWGATRDETAKLRPELKIKRVPSVVKTGKGIHYEVDNLKSRYEYIIIDAGGKDSVELRSAMLIADKLYTPVLPSQFDVWTIGTMEKLVEDARFVNKNLKAYVVLSRASTNVKVTDADEAKALVKELENLALAKTVIFERQAYRKAAKNGLSVLELEDRKEKKAQEEFMEFYREALI